MTRADQVKSAARAFEIIEVFASKRRRLTATELGEALGYPKSSLNVLLKSLVSQGYLSMQQGTLSYFPTLRLTQLGDWLPVALFGSNAFFDSLNILRDQTNETVTLTMAAGAEMRVLRALLGTHPIALQLNEDYSFPIIGTAVGTAYLATLPDPALDAFLARRDVMASGGHPLDNATLKSTILQARALGYTSTYDALLDDTGAVAIPIQSRELGETLVVAVAGLGHRIKRNEQQIVAKLMAWAADCLERPARSAANPQTGRRMPNIRAL
jgi:DNA-binding IclR family transcriptional regulator